MFLFRLGRGPRGAAHGAPRRHPILHRPHPAQVQHCSLIMPLFPTTATASAAARLAADAGAEQDLDEDELLLARMDAGLYTLQQVGGALAGAGGSWMDSRRWWAGACGIEPPECAAVWARKAI